MGPKLAQAEQGRLPLILLAVVSSIGQFATNIQLPSFVAISGEFGVSDAIPPLTLAIYLLAFAITQLFAGPISDRAGRKPMLLISLVVFILGTTVSATAPNMAVLFIGRCIEGIGAGGSLVVGRAVIRDHLDGPNFVRAIALVTAFGAIFPSFAPLVGGGIQHLLGWRWAMIFNGGVGFIAFILVFIRLPPGHRSSISQQQGSYLKLINKEFLWLTIGSSAAMGAMFAFFSGSPLVLVGKLNISALEFGLYPPIVATFYAFGAITVRHLQSSKYSNKVFGLIASIFMGLGALYILIYMMLDAYSKWSILSGTVVFVYGLGIYLTIAVASAMQMYPNEAGATSAIIGFFQTLGGALSGAVVALSQATGSIAAFAAVMLLMSIMASLCISLTLEKTRMTPS